MAYTLEYYLNYWGPFVISLAVMLVFVKLARAQNKTRDALTKELIEVNRQSLVELGEIKSLLEDRKS